MYEDLKTDTISTVREIFKFLQMDIDENRLQCVEDHKQGNFKRKEKPKPFDFYPYTLKQKNNIYEAIYNVNQVLNQLHKQSLPFQNYNHYDEKEYNNFLSNR